MLDVVPVRALAREAWTIYAHTPPAADPNQWHTFRDHAESVGELAAEFAAPFGGASLARLLGYTHDAGKCTDEVQRALRERSYDGGRRLGVPHKFEGSALASLLLEAGNMSAAVAMCLANRGHHSGIPNLRDGSEPPIEVLQFMDGNRGHLDELVALLDQQIGVSLRDLAAQVSLPDWLPDDPDKDGTTLELFTRMCHSCLVDADFLDTAAHFKGEEAPWRSPTRGIGALHRHFFDTYRTKYASAPRTPLNELRRTIFLASTAAARTAGSVSRGGIYRLPAPTGTGKTMAAAAFALEHAKTFGKRRVIIAVPFTSITTQNAEEYRQRFAGLGDDVVLEHHSNILEESIADDSWRRLSASNWDSEFIVTTTVQLFDSLFSNRPSSTRKLHRIVDSVVVIDEVQALPLKVLPSILKMLRELVEHYGVTVLLASATQPSFWSLDVWKDLDPVDIIPLEVVPEITQRVTYDVRADEASWDEIAAEVSVERQALVVVNTTKDAQLLHGLIRDRTPDVEVLHLSARMCQQHRHDVLAAVRGLLSAKRPLILVSTQLIEAGVDVDFAVVFRALAPAESVVQSAGRCNREGHLGIGGGRVVVFRPAEGGLPQGDYKRATRETESQFVEQPLRQPDGKRAGYQFGEPAAMKTYFEELYRICRSSMEELSVEVDRHRETLAFASTEEKFQMIENGTVAVLVTGYGDPADRYAIESIVDRYRSTPGFVPDRHQRRLLQTFSASVPATLLRTPQIEQLPDGPYLWGGEYDADSGVVLGTPGQALIL